MTSPSTMKSCFVRPWRRAARATSRMMPILPSAVSGISPSVSGSRMNMAPYLAASGSSFRIFSLSPDMELMSARPG